MAFADRHGRSPRWGWFVPGRIEIFGKHTDYAGGRSLMAAVPRGFAIVASPRDDRTVSATDVVWDASVEVEVDDEARAYAGWANYIAVVARRLARNFPGASIGADVAFASDLPRAAGLSSSSALVVGIATALIRAGQLESRPEWTSAIRSSLDLAGYLGAVENGLTFGTLEGTGGVGTHGGSEDHTAILNCQAQRVSAYSYVPVRHQGDGLMPRGWQFVVMASGVEASKAGAARGRYNSASLATRALVEAWRRRTGGAPVTLAALLASDPAAEGIVRDAIRPDGHGEFTADDLDRRLSHFIAEDGRVPRALEAFRRSDAAALGRLSAESQRDAEALLGNQIPETTALASLAREHGAFAASSFGAGFGGSVWALVTADEAAAFGERWQARYAVAFPGVKNVVGFIARPGPSVTDLRLEE